jgi:hypothetical protein
VDRNRASRVDASSSRWRQSTVLKLALDALRDGGGTVYGFLHDKFNPLPCYRCHKSVTGWDLENGK